MAERYTRISENHDILYFASSPLTIEATSLLKDNIQEKLIAQIKLKNISSKIIKAVFLKLSLLDASGSYLEDIEYQYLDLNTKSHEVFGQKNAVVLPNPYTRAFELSLLKVVYSDGDVWEASSDNSFRKLSQQRNINNVFSQSEVEKYQSFLGEKALYEPVESENIWLCCCGEINRDDEDICHNCQNKKEDVFRFSDEEYLNKEYTYQLAYKKINSKDPDTILSAIPLLEQIPHWKDSDELLGKCEELAQEAQSNNKYEEAIAKAKEDTKEALTDAISIMESLQGWNDSDDKIAIYKKRIIEIEENDRAQQELKKAKAKKIKIIVAGVLICVICTFIIKFVIHSMQLKTSYNNAKALYETGEYEQAKDIFVQLSDYKDSEDQIKKCELAITENEYNAAIALIEEGDITNAYESLIALNGYKDSAEKAEEIYEQYRLLNPSIGDIVSFGSYEQDNNETNGVEDIEWIVLAKEGRKMLVISRYALDCRKFDPDCVGIWENCQLREWLNNTFLLNAFSEEERAMIPSVEVDDDGNKSYSISPRNSTIDKVFLLSVTEANEYFDSDEARKCVPTTYAIEKGVEVSDYEEVDGKGTCEWWMRSPGNNSDLATTVGEDGYVSDCGDYADNSFVKPGVRPALWINPE